MNDFLNTARRATRTAAWFVLACLSSACHSPTYLSATSQGLLDYERGLNKSVDMSQPRFVLDDFGTLNSHALETNALPWKVYSTALLLGESAKRGKPIPLSEDSVYEVMGRYGFIRPRKILNWETERAPEPKLTAPLGLQRGTAHAGIPGLLPLRVEIANINCSVCHAGVVYDASGSPTRDVWLGMPNTSINFAGYVSTIYAGLKIGAQDTRRFLRQILATHPMTHAEYYTLKLFVMKEFRKQFAMIQATSDHAAPFPMGGPGLTNGVGAFKFELGMLTHTDYDPDEAGYASVPELGNRAFRTSLLYDGIYSVIGQQPNKPMTRAEATPEHLTQDLSRIAAFFTVGTAGGSFSNAEAVIPRVREAMGYLTRYEPMRFPGKVDPLKAEQGSLVYDDRCSQCHGTYSYDPAKMKAVLESFPNRVVPLEDWGTDPYRYVKASQAQIDKVAKDPGNAFNRHVIASKKGGYVAPLLSGLWATAPYLHNGSVPTLWHLMHPESRPAGFYVGGHKLDYQKVGIAGDTGTDGIYRYPADYRPWSEPALYSDKTPGCSNRGHEKTFIHMNEDEKEQLLEFLKLL